MGAAVLPSSTLAPSDHELSARSERTGAIGRYGATAGVRASLGLVVSGALTDHYSWRAGFSLNVPIEIALVLAGRRFLPRDGAAPRAA